MLLEIAETTRMIEMIEGAETIDQVQDLKKDVDFQGRDKTLETSFH